MSHLSHVLSQGPFDTLEDAFEVLCAEPRPLGLEAGVVAGLPARPMALTELRAVLLHPSTGYRVRNQAISVLLDRARSEGGRWTVGLAGVLVFGLRRATSGLCEVCPHKAADIEAEALAGLLEGIAKTDPGRNRLAARLIWLARNRAKALVAKELAEVGRPGRHLTSEVPARLYGHPDLVLVEAVAEGVIEAVDPLAGSYFVEWLTDEVERRTSEYLERIEERGRAVAAIEQGYLQDEIEQAAYEHAKGVDSGEKVVVGVNRFAEDEPEPPEVFPIDPALQRGPARAGAPRARGTGTARRRRSSSGHPEPPASRCVRR